MRDETPSRTAAWVAAARGAGILLPEAVRLADDPYGAAFSSPRLQRMIAAAARRGSGIAGLPGLGEWILYMQVRTRMLDDAARDFAEDGGRQLVLLGAGYDCRAIRLAELDGAAVFEVDHPATQRHKRAVLERIQVSSPSSHIAWDFEKRAMSELPAALAAAGHDPASRTLTIWEGVTMYLTEPAIEDSVRAIASYSAAGSKLAMTYFNRARMARPSLATRAVAAVVARLGEPWRWGWDPAELPAWMQARGFHIEKDISLAEAARELLPPELARRIHDPSRRIAVAARESIALTARDRAGNGASTR
jgi:methyltransferase (TIGR00027 family)